MHLDPGPLVVVVVLAAAVLHASWNAIAHAAEDRLVGFALISTSTAVIGTVMVVVGGRISWHYFWLAALSAALHVAYLLLLMASYQLADLSRAYPLSRGTGVALVAIASVALPRSPLGPDIVVGAGSWSSACSASPSSGRLTRTDSRGSPSRWAQASRSPATRSWTACPCPAARRWSRTRVADAPPVLGGPRVRRGQARREIVAIARKQAGSGLTGGACPFSPTGWCCSPRRAVRWPRSPRCASSASPSGSCSARPSCTRRSPEATAPALVLTLGAVVLALGIA